MDLDDMLDDIDLDTIESKPKGDDILNSAASNVFFDEDKDDIADDELQQQMEAAELSAWTTAISKISPSVREKWTTIVKADSKAINTSKFQPSYAYKLWNGEGDGTKPVSYTPGVSRILHELIRTSALKAGHIEETKIAKLIALSDPLKGNQGKTLNNLFSKQLIRDNEETIRSDINYDKDKFPKMQEVLHV